DRDVDHPVVTGWHADRDGASDNVRARVDRRDVCREEPSASLRLVHGRDAVLRERVDDRAVGPRRVADDYSRHGRSETWTTPLPISPPTARMAVSTSASPYSCVVSGCSGNRFDASWAIASSTAR